MDTDVINAITIVQLDEESTQQRWFELMCRTYDELSAADRLDWQYFTSSLSSGTASAGLSSDIAEQFVQALTASDPHPLETIGRLREVADELPRLYREFATTDTAATGYDETAWNSFLAEHGPYWNGDDAAWGEFRVWFLYEAEQRGLADPGQAFIAYVEGQGDRRGVFAMYGVSIADPAAATGYDETVWNSFLAEHGPYWNGDDAAWGQFRVWFLYEAEQRGLADPGQAFIAYVEGQSDRRGVFAQYGVTIAGVAAERQAEPVDVRAHPRLQRGDSGEWVAHLDEMLTLNGF